MLAERACAASSADTSGVRAAASSEPRCEPGHGVLVSLIPGSPTIVIARLLSSPNRCNSLVPIVNTHWVFGVLNRAAPTRGYRSATAARMAGSSRSSNHGPNSAVSNPSTSA